MNQSTQLTLDFIINNLDTLNYTDAQYIMNNIKPETKKLLQIISFSHTDDDVSIMEEGKTVEMETNIPLMVQYSKKCIAVFRGTVENHYDFKLIGGKFNKYLKLNGIKQSGWIFHNSKKKIVEEYLDFVKQSM